MSISDQIKGEYDLELLLCIDGYSSSEEAGQLHPYLQHQRLNTKLIFTEGQWGLAKCLNELIKYSDTDAFVRHDDDDIMLRDRILNTSKIFRENQGPILFGSNYYTLRMVELSKSKSNRHKITLVNAPTRQNLNELFTVSPPFAHPSIAFSATNKGGFVPLYDERYTYAQDFKFYLDHLNSFEFTSAPFESIIYRVPDLDPIKRRHQLDFHDLALFEFFNKYFETKLENAKEFRCKYISSEFCDAQAINHASADQFARSVINANIKYRKFT